MPTGRGRASNPQLLDSSAAVALLVTDHTSHRATFDSLDGAVLGLAGHAFFEAYSVMTRLPPPARRSPADVALLLRHNFPETRFLGVERSRQLSRILPELGIAGGSVYDALVGAVAAEHGLTLVSRDVRARDTYRTVGADVRLLD